MGFFGIPGLILGIGLAAPSFAADSLALDTPLVTTAGAAIFDFPKWSSAVATGRNDDGTLSFVTIDPRVDGFTFVVGERDGKKALKKALVIRDASMSTPLLRRASVA